MWYCGFIVQHLHSHQVQADQVWQRQSGSADILRSQALIRSQVKDLQPMTCQVAQVPQRWQVEATELHIASVILPVCLLHGGQRREDELRETTRQSTQCYWKGHLQTKLQADISTRHNARALIDRFIVQVDPATAVIAIQDAFSDTLCRCREDAIDMQ